MAEDPKPFRCRICDQLRERDANHWWVVVLRNAIEPGEFIELRQWNSVLARRAGSPEKPGNAFIWLACGLKCLSVLAERLGGEMVARAQDREANDRRAKPSPEQEPHNAD